MLCFTAYVLFSTIVRHRLMSFSGFSECFLKMSHHLLNSHIDLFEYDYPPEVNNQRISVDNFVPDMLNDNLGDGLDILKVSEHVKTQVADVVFKYVSVERDFDQLNVHFWRIILLENVQQLSVYNKLLEMSYVNAFCRFS